MFDVCIKGHCHNNEGTTGMSLPDHYWIPIWEWCGQVCDDLIGLGEDSFHESGLYSANDTFIPMGIAAVIFGFMYDSMFLV